MTSDGNVSHDASERVELCFLVVEQLLIASCVLMKCALRLCTLQNPQHSEVMGRFLRF